MFSIIVAVKPMSKTKLSLSLPHSGEAQLPKLQLDTRSSVPNTVHQLLRIFPCDGE